ncbi:MAG TPA: hypothetical protein PKD00_10665, partial [Burkholderiales bacterium]|nr:hypothetical protein [Burkholderiales bacterium]
MSNKINFDIDCLRDKVSYSKKSKNDFEWAKQRCEYYDTHYYDITLKKFKRMKALYRIYKGMPTPEDYKFLTNPVDKNLSSTVPFVSYPIVDKVIKAIHGEEIRRPLKPIVFALNQDSLSKRSREKLELTKQYVYNSVFGAIDQEIQAAMEQAKSEEEAAQIQKQGEEKKAAMAPPEIDLFMSKEFRLPEEMQGQHILNAKLKTEKPKHSFDTALLHGLISGMGLVRITNARKPKIEALEPLFFDYEMSKGPDKIFIHKGNRWSYSQYMTLAEIYDEYGDDMSKKDKEKLDELRDKYRHEEMYPNPSMYNWEILEDLDDPMVWLDDRYIRVAHHVFRTLKEIGHLTRINLETGEIEELIVEEEYEINPLTDISLEFEWIPELWEITKIDIHDTIYTRIGPIEGQYRDLEDPHTVTPPYMGVVYDIINPDSPASIIQNGSYWQELYDIVMHYFKTTLATDWGNIITLSVNAK